MDEDETTLRMNLVEMVNDLKGKRILKETLVGFLHHYGLVEYIPEEDKKPIGIKFNNQYYARSEQGEYVKVNYILGLEEGEK